MAVLAWVVGAVIAVGGLLFASPTVRRYSKMKKM